MPIIQYLLKGVENKIGLLLNKEAPIKFFLVMNFFVNSFQEIYNHDYHIHKYFRLLFHQFVAQKYIPNHHCKVQSNI